jgi:RND family efflux transporter MFP subunit
MRATKKLMGFALSSSLVCLLVACDKADPAAGLPASKGDGAPPRVEVATPGGSTDGTHAQQTANHRWVGTAQAKHHVELAPGMTGVIAAIEVEEGDTVVAGQQVFRIKGAEVKLMVSQAEAAVASAELAFGEAGREAERTRKLAERGSVGTANLERAEAGVEAAAAAVKQAKAAASLARSRTGELTVETPISGVVTRRLQDVGEMATMMPPTIVLVIDDLSIIEVRVRVPELKLREIDVGTPVTVYFPALDHSLEVPITRIGNAVDPRTRTIELIIEVANPDMRIKSGMSVEVAIEKKTAAKSEPPASDAAEPDATKPAAGSDAAKPTAESSDSKPAEPKPDSLSPTAMIVEPGKAG